MKRVSELLKYADLDGTGIEVAPFFNPAVPKRSGNNVLIIDVFDADKLRQIAEKDEDIPNDRIHEIEDVDFVGDACKIGKYIKDASLTGKISYIISSHNFEHLPNPILFLQGCSDALKNGGVLSMAVPDYRACFDYYRMPTRLSDWLNAYHEGRQQPSAETLFDSDTMGSRYIKNGMSQPGCNIAKDDPGNFISNRQLESAYKQYQSSYDSKEPYRDVHVSVLFPELLELLLWDLRKIGLINLEPIEMTKTNGLEFFVHLRKTDEKLSCDDEEFYARRDILLNKVSRNIGAAPYQICISTSRYRNLRASLSRLRKSVKNLIKRDSNSSDRRKSD